MIEKSEVKHLAKLTRLELNENDLEKYAKDLNSIADLTKEIKAIDTDNVTETYHILKTKNVFRKDEVKESKERKDILKNAKTTEAGCVSVPRVVE